MQRIDPDVSATRTCGECRFARFMGSDINQRVCGRYPPQASMAATHQGVGIVSLRPNVKPTDEACGEFAAKQ
jgi:hypothetical protein